MLTNTLVTPLKPRGSPLIPQLRDHTHISLLDLPSELPTLIADCVEASELRKFVVYLLIPKPHAAVPVYLSQLPLLDLYLASHHA